MPVMAGLTLKTEMNWLQAFIDRKFPDNKGFVEDIVTAIFGLIFGVVMFYMLGYFGYLD